LLDHKEEESLQMMLMKIYHLYFSKVFRYITDLGVHPGQIPLIRLLGKEEGLSQREISQKLHIKPPTVTVSLRRMENSGLIKRLPDERDQRVSHNYLTEKGMEMYHMTHELADELEQYTFKGFTESEKCLMRRLFAQMIENLDDMSILEKKQGTDKEEM